MEFFQLLGDKCSGFVVVDEDTAYLMEESFLALCKWQWGQFALQCSDGGKSPHECSRWPQKEIGEM